MGTLATAALLLGAASAGTHAARGGRASILGIVPHTGVTAARQLHAVGTSGYGPLVYHGGWTMRSNTTYAIYWVPGGSYVSPGYESLIDRYFTDVAAASGSTSNVYSVATQYYDTTGPIAYSSTFGGSYVDTNAFPASGCSDGSDPVCLTDQQLETEIQSVIGVNHWPEAQTSLFFIMTPDNVGICADSSSAQCTTNAFCAYHSGFNGTSGPVVYAVEPYDATIGGGNSCWDGTSPNGNDADATINTISHEQNEAITDPAGTGWWSNDGAEDEMADLCTWDFGSALGGTPGHSYNQVINGDHYWLQTEYSNEGGTCLQSYAVPPAPASISLPVVSGVAAVGQVLTTTAGAWTGSATTYAYQWQECAADTSGCVDIAGATGSSYRLGTGDAGHTVRSEVVAGNTGGSSPPAMSAPTAVVIPVPASTARPDVTGAATVGRRLSVTPGSWDTTATFTYRWLRCHAKRGRCTTIAHATSSTYTLASADRGHTIEAQVSATNAAGTTAVLSAHTAVVVGVPAVVRRPRISGRLRVNRRLSARKGIWRGPPTRYRYEWLRCNVRARSCRRIKGARYVRYRVRTRDVGHRLRVRVIAVDAAGKARTISRPSRIVPDRRTAASHG